MTKTSEAFGVLRALIALWRDILGTAKRAGTCDPPSEAAASAADFLVTGDKQDLLHLSHHEGARMITVRDFLALHKRLPLQKIRHH